ncbi:hypothetical protein FHR83_009349 [Actinoplanes campanulatus]|uniref:Chromosome segregation ATPase n=1 Tax=Actinoplanes campanulatus TaxID=113559 RepID=A0A7W5FKA6_9ACTN|nr:hypothetical protein [Actinoplanes campanulatus]MBB3101618.1 hypothetical protein [Actinoplanes campanulatus]GGN51705.1 hypothetical protein GCM10010109_92060 [Actinoplanes campanulatus]GID42682.1 hypothetical protein Aca09nite_91880 [Actinoplanes campanulatus]
MYELSKVRLYSVGPSGARYEDVIIDLSGAGDPVPDQQLQLGRPELRRPSPASILFLENGGGKSVLIKLIFSVMLPGRRHVVGTSNTKVLENFVGRHDVAHVVLEWMHTRTGRLLLTGKVSDWRGRSPQSGEENLVDLWYSLRPNDLVNIATLPFADDGHNLVASDFRSRLDDLADEDPVLDLEWADKHARWSAWLVKLGLDSELFRFQRAMNAGEGEAADAFTFATDEAFVDFLLKSVLPADELGDLAESIAVHARTLATRADLELESTFVTDAIAHLEPLDQQRSVTEQAVGEAAGAVSDLDGLVARLVARVDHENGLLEHREKHIEEVAEGVAAAESARNRAVGIHAALDHHTARLRRDAAHAEQQAAADAKGKAEHVVHSWAATPALLDLEKSSGLAAALREVVGQRQDAARVALSARDARSRELARALLSTADRADTEASQEESELAEVRRTTEDAEQTWQAAVQETAQANVLAAHLQERIAGVDAEVAQAVRASLITSPATLAEDSASLAESVRADMAAITETELLLETRRAEVDEAKAGLAQAREARIAAQSHYAGAQAELRRAEDATEVLAREPRLVELLDTADVLLEYDADTLLDQLAHAQSDIDAQRTEMKVGNAADEPALLVWQADPEALLSPHQEVIRIRDLLDSEGIACGTGWDYLADRTDETIRADLVRRLPHLAGGVLVNKPEHLARAREIIDTCDSHPTGTVFVATTRSFDVVVDAQIDLAIPATAGFVAPPNAGLFDHTAAQAEYARIAERYAIRKARLAELDALYSVDRALAARLAEWRRMFPPGTLGGLAESVATAEAAVQKAAADVDDHERALEHAIVARDGVQSALSSKCRALNTLKERSRQLAELASRGREAEGWRRDAVQARDQAVASEQRAARLLGMVNLLRRDIEDRQRRADGQRALAERIREEARDLPTGTTVDSRDPIPAEPVAVLRAVLGQAQRVYEKAEVGDDQLKELTQAENRAKDALQLWEKTPAEVRDTARVLLASTNGADGAARAAAIGHADNALRAAAHRHTRAAEETTRLDERLRQLPRPAVALSQPDQPRDVAHGEQLTAAAVTAAADAKAEHEERIAQLAVARKDAERARATVESFKTIIDMHRAARDDQFPAEATGVEPFPGDAGLAGDQYRDHQRAAVKKQKAAAEAQRGLDALAERLRQFAAETRFARLTVPIRTLISEVAISALAGYAAEWVRQLRPRLRSLSDDLAQVDRHRTIILERLTAIVDSALRKLRAAQRLSKLPEGLGEWTGLEFLHIGGTPVEGELLAHQLGGVLDDAVERYIATEKRDGLGVVQRAVRAAVPKGFKVTMLKPDAVLRAERVRISAVRDVFSGGQHLTAAIILYCTLAALRANDLGKTRRHHSGVLFLDNPIGRASATYLLDLQRGVAAALGVQLIYTTGLYEEEALAGFPLIVRLRNDADLRAGRKYLSVDERIMPYLEGLASPDDTGVVTPTRILIPERRRGDTY